MAKTLTTAELDALERSSAPAPTVAPKKTLSTAELDAMEQASAPAAGAPADSGPMWESALRGFSQGATLGFGDEIQAGFRAAKQKLTGEDTRPYGEVYTSLRDQERAANAASATDNPVTHFVSNLVGGVPSALAGGGSAKAAAALGGGAGLGSSSGDVTDAAISTATGAALGGGLQAALPYVGKAASAVKRGVGEFAGRVADDFGLTDVLRRIPLESVRKFDPEYLRAGRAAKDAGQDIVAVDKARQEALKASGERSAAAYNEAGAAERAGQKIPTESLDALAAEREIRRQAQEAATAKLAGLDAKRKAAVDTRSKAMAEVDRMKADMSNDVDRSRARRLGAGAIRAGLGYASGGLSTLESVVPAGVRSVNQAAEGWKRASALPEKAVRPTWAAIMDTIRTGGDSVKAAQDMYVAQETDPEARKRLAGKE